MTLHDQTVCGKTTVELIASWSKRSLVPKSFFGEGNNNLIQGSENMIYKFTIIIIIIVKSKNIMLNGVSQRW